MTVLVVEAERCKGCGYCVMACPKKAIRFSGKLNRNGYNYIEVDDELCVKCGTCYTVCPDLVYEIVEK